LIGDAATPSREAVLGLKGPETHVAIRVSLLADSETPISLFATLADREADCFLLESVEGGELVGRYSFLGVDPVERIELDDGVARIHRDGAVVEEPYEDFLGYLRERLGAYRVLAQPDLPRFQGGLVGYIGYDAVRHFEPVPAATAGEGPDAALLLVDTLVIYDHVAHRLELIAHVALEGDRDRNYARAVERLESLASRFGSRRDRPALGLLPARPAAGDKADPRDLECNVDDDTYARVVDEVREAIRDGEIFQVVLSRRWTMHRKVDPLALYRALRATNPSPYMFFLSLGETKVVGASPEVLVRLEEGEILLRPIAGTRPRGADASEDAALAADLLADEKELAEHRMLVDLARNDAGRVAEVGTVEVHRPLHIERYSHVMHIVSDVRARVRDGLDAFDVFRSSFPAGTVSGAPKMRAMEIIAAREGERRGVYAGAVGYFDFSGNMDTCIAIRTMVLEGDRVQIQAGAGIVFDSVGSSEATECRNKAKGALAALELAREVAR
jgi:anthranilate synthase component 1